jgi:ribosomal protein S18 acetylase RimI-like enzyme
VRRFVPADLDAVVALWNRVFGYPEPRNDPARVIAAKLEHDGLLLVAVENERIIGSLMLGYDGHRGWLYRAAVDESARRRGVGRALVLRGEAELAALGCSKINLQLHAHNEAGVRFWQALGYVTEPRISMGKDTLEAAARAAPPLAAAPG